MDTILVTVRDASGLGLQIDEVAVDASPLVEGTDYLVQDAVDLGPDVRWLLVSGFYQDANLEITASAG